MPYAPSFSTRSTVSLRRIAWSLDVPMTVAMEKVMDILPLVMPAQKVCAKCQDRSRCTDCVFKTLAPVRPERLKAW